MLEHNAYSYVPWGANPCARLYLRRSRRVLTGLCDNHNVRMPYSADPRDSPVVSGIHLGESAGWSGFRLGESPSVPWFPRGKSAVSRGVA